MGRLRIDRQVDLVDRSLRVHLAVDNHHQGSRHKHLVDRPVVDRSPDAVVGIPEVDHLDRPALLGKVLGLEVSRVFVYKGTGEWTHSQSSFLGSSRVVHVARRVEQ